MEKCGYSLSLVKLDKFGKFVICSYWQSKIVILTKDSIPVISIITPLALEVPGVFIPSVTAVASVV